LIADIISGAGYFFRGFQLVKQRGLRRFVLIPLLINSLVFSGAILIGIDKYNDLLSWILPAGNRWWAEIARVVLWVFFAAAALVVLLFVFTLVANLIGAPFNGLLSEKVALMLAEKREEDAGGLSAFIATIVPSIVSELRKIVYFLFLAAIVFILTLIPVINIFAPFLWLLFSSWMLAVEYLAYPMENRKLYFSQVKTRLRQDRWLALGFGMVAVGAGLIPVVNFFVMPVAVAGATALWVERLSREDRAREVQRDHGSPTGR